MPNGLTPGEDSSRQEDAASDDERQGTLGRSPDGVINQTVVFQNVNCGGGQYATVIQRLGKGCAAFHRGGADGNRSFSHNR